MTKPSPKPSIIFLGSPIFAVPSLQALHAAGFPITAVYTQPPRPAGRGGRIKKTAVHKFAEELNLPIRSPEKLQGNALAELLATPIDVMVVVAYGQLLSQKVLDHAPCLNVHFSALPRWRGAAPVQHAIMAGDSTIDISIQKMVLQLDSGPLYYTHTYPLPPHATSQEIYTTLANLAAAPLVNVTRNVATLVPIPQVGTPTHAPKLTPTDRIIDWHKTATAIHNQIRAIGGTATLLGESVKLAGSTPLTNIPTSQHPNIPVGTILTTTPLTIACGHGTILQVSHLQRPGGRMLPVAEILKALPTPTHFTITPSPNHTPTDD